MSNEITVVAWVDDEDQRLDGCNCKVGGLGGWVDGHGWPDLIEHIKPEVQPYYEAVRKSVIENRIWKCGDWHQRDAGTPLFSDHTYGSWSLRGWGDLLAAIWNTALNTTEYSYMSFYYIDPPEEPDEWPTP